MTLSLQARNKRMKPIETIAFAVALFAVSFHGLEPTPHSGPKGDLAYVASVTSQVFHQLDLEWARRIDADNRPTFKTGPAESPVYRYIDLLISAWRRLLFSESTLVFPSLVAMILARVYWRRCPRACLFALIGFGVLFLQGILNSLLTVWAYDLTEHPEWGIAPQQFMDGVLLFTLVARGLGIIFVIMAVFTGRRPAAVAPPPPPPPPL